MKMLLRWVLLAVSVAIASAICVALGLGFKVHVASTGDALKLLLGVMILSFLNATLGKILKFITMPLSCLTLGLFALVINALVLMIAASLNMGFTLEGSGFQAFIAAFVASILISLVSGALGVFLPDKKNDD
ncbi:MAG: phage holin family protein [Armatimonadetes bacterium]|nr:phage holin family protein [Armatimonadota bacterium]